MTQFNKARHARTPSFNDEWPVFSTIQASPSSQQQVIVRPEDKTKQLDISNLATNDDLTTLKKKDAFMYYSIPSIKDAAYVFEDVELSNITEKSSMRRNCISCPSRMQTESETSLTEVKRRTRISFECHSDMFDMFPSDEGGEEEKQEGGDMDYLLIMMENFAVKR